MAANYQIAVAAIFAFALIGCTQSAASHHENQLSMTGVVPPKSQSDLLVCRIRQEDKVFDDVLAFKVPVHDDKHQPQSDCHAMVEAEQSALKSTRTIPILDLGFIWLGAAALWMVAHPEVHQCVEKVDEPNFVLARFLGRAPDTKGPTTVLLKRCDDHLFFVTNAEISAGTTACGQAHIPGCAS